MTASAPETPGDRRAGKPLDHREAKAGDTQPPKPGNRRSAGTHQAIVTAARDMLHEVGYASTTIEGIAARAGVGKTTIYRWWPSKGALLGEALASVLRKGPEQETGDLRRDLVETIAVTIDNYTGEGAEMILVAFAAHVERDGGLLASFREGFLAERRRHGQEMLHRAMARGELPDDADIEMIMDIWAGTILYRSLITGAPLPPDLPEQLTDLLLSGTIPRVRPTRASGRRRAGRSSPVKTT